MILGCLWTLGGKDKWTAHLLTFALAGASLLLSSCGDLGDTRSGPIVVGYERFYSDHEASPEGGEILVLELGCTSCHQVPDRIAVRLGDYQAPLLDGVGSRLTQNYIERFVADPPSMVPGTRMPGLFRGWPEEERKEAVLDLSSFLVSQAAPLRVSEAPAAAKEIDLGERLYHTVGCIACHRSLRPPLSHYANGEDGYAVIEVEIPDPTVPSVPLPDQRLKTALPPLADFLENPLRIRPSGRMPRMGLSQREAQAIASYLLKEKGEANGVGPLKLNREPIDPERVERGRGLFSRLRCAACHLIGSSQEAVEPTPSLPGMLELDPDDPGGCLGEAPMRAVPDFNLNPTQRAALKAALQRLQDQNLAVIDPRAQVRRTLTLLNCFACHRRDDWGGPEAGRAAYFTSTQEIDLAEEGRIPPPLTGAGRKLTPRWLEKVLKGDAKLRPYLATRMPVYGMKNLEHLVKNLVEADRDPDPPEIDVGGGQPHHRNHHGRRLMGLEAFNCVNCHDLLGRSSLGMPALDLATTVERLQPVWFKQFLLDPDSFRPQTLMPAFFSEGRSTITEVLAGDANKQIEAIWIYLKELDQTRLPKGMEAEEAFEIVPRDRPLLLRTFMEKVGTHAIAVGYPEGIHAAFDALNVRFALAWMGRFLDAESTWADRYSPFTPALSSDQTAPGSGMPFGRLPTSGSPWPHLTGSDADYRMGGYRVGSDGVPVFFYSFGSVDIEERIAPAETEAVLRKASGKQWLMRTFELSGESDEIWFRALAAPHIDDRGNGLYVSKQLKVRLRSEPAARPILRRSDPGMEVLLSVRFRGGRARIEQELTW